MGGSSLGQDPRRGPERGYRNLGLGRWLIMTFHRHSLDLDAIGVPDAEQGGVSRARSQHSTCGTRSTACSTAQTNMALTGVDTTGSCRNHYPKTGLSLAKACPVAVPVVCCPGWRHAGFGRSRSVGNGISLQLRLNGRVIFSETAKECHPDAADTLLRRTFGNHPLQVDRPNLRFRLSRKERR